MASLQGADFGSFAGRAGRDARDAMLGFRRNAADAVATRVWNDAAADAERAVAALETSATPSGDTPTNAAAQKANSAAAAALEAEVRLAAAAGAALAVLPQLGGYRRIPPST